MHAKYINEIHTLSNKEANNLKNESTLEKIKKDLPKSNKKKKELLEFSVESLTYKIKEKDYNSARGILRFIFFTNFKDPMNEVRKQGCFRSSKSDFHTGLISELISELLASNVLSAQDLKYLNNITSLLMLASDMRDIKRKITVAAKSRRYFLKTILSIAENNFNDLFYGASDFEEPHTNNDTYKNSKESILSAISYVVQIHRETVGNIKIQDSNGIDENTSTDYYQDIINSAFGIVQFLESEIKVDCFSYDATCDHTKTKILVENFSFEQAKTNGYIKTYLRQQSHAQKYSKIHNLKSYFDFLEEFWAEDSKQNESIIYSIINPPNQRIVLKAPLLNYGHKANLFSQDVQFKEEVIQLTFLANESYTTEILTKEICANFTVFDILKIQRLFGFVSFIYRKAYEKLKNNLDPKADEIRNRSVLPVFDKEVLISFFESITGKQKADCEILISKLINDDFSAGKFLDLQYTPILSFAHRYIVLPTIFAHSNIIRSIALRENMHLSVFDNRDFMIESVIASLLNRGFTAEQDVDFGQDEIDIAAVHGEHLFLFECKNPYHPVNDFELRNTFSHITKGFSQLEKFKERFKDSNSLKQFLTKIKADHKKITEVHYGIINANRALAGLEKNGIKVLHANELISFIDTGIITSGESILHCWSGDFFEPKDLVAFMAGKTLTDDLVHQKSELYVSLQFRIRSLCLRTFEYNLSEVAIAQAKKYRKIGIYPNSQIE